jgi:Zn-finger nucleic acid-binding protein
VFRDDTPICPSCDAALARTKTRLACEHCNGAMVGDAELVRMLEDLGPDDERGLDARLAPATSPSRRCPCCATMMTAHMLNHTLIDRCPEHGVWFDAGELEQVLFGTAHATRTRRAVGKASAALGFGGAYLGLELLWFGPTVAGPAFALAGCALAIGAIRRWRSRRRPLVPGQA